MATPKRNDADGRVAATRLFRLLNPELFIKPNRIVMALGLASVTGLIAYFIIDNQRYQNENAAEMERYRERLRTARRQRAERMSIEDSEPVE